MVEHHAEPLDPGLLPHSHKVPWLRRVYALIPIALVLFLSYRAIDYLVVQLLVPYEPPRQVTAIPARLTEDVWRQPPDRFLGTVLSEYPRMPLAHYHRIDGWFQPDPVSSCTQVGCHVPMPHAENKATRAFHNMHATSMHCTVCHLETAAEPLPLVWYDLEDGDETEPPALLRAWGLIASPEGRERFSQPTAADQARLVELVRAAAKQAGGSPLLNALANDLDAVRHTSQQFQTAVEVARIELPLHMRGEYGAKLTLRDTDTGQPMYSHPGTQDLIKEYLERGADLPAAQREELLTRLHPLRREQTLRCSACHAPDTPLLDLESVGYPPARVAQLREGWIFRAIEDIDRGQRLTLPSFIAPTTSPHDSILPGGTQE